MDEKDIRFIVQRKYDGKFLAETWKWFDSIIDSTFFPPKNLGYLTTRFGVELYNIIEVDVSVEKLNVSSGESVNA